MLGTSTPHPDFNHRRWLLFAGAFVLGTATYGMMQIETTSGNQDSFLPALYHSLQLFVINGSRYPIGGPALWVGVVWFAHFAAPLLTWSAIVKFAVAVHDDLLGPHRQIENYKDHIVICGLGKHGRLLAECYLAQLSAKGHAAPKIVVVEKQQTTSRNIVELRVNDDLVVRAPIIQGDMREAHVLKKAGVGSSRRVYASSGDDITNLATALLAKDLGAKEVFATVGDVSLTERLIDFAKSAGVEVVNIYEKAAAQLIDEVLDNELFGAGADAYMVIAGFGRFGQVLARCIERSILSANAKPGAEQRTLTVQIVDKLASTMLERYRARVPDSHSQVPVSYTAIDGDIADLERLVPLKERKLTIAICTDDDPANLSLALELASYKSATGVVVTRFFEQLAGLEKLSSQGIRPFAVADLARSNSALSCCFIGQRNR